jgi:hypothetical protein
MKPGHLLPIFAIAILSLLGALAAPAQDQQIKSTFIHLGQGVPGVLYEPVNPGPKAQIGVFVMHAEGDYLTFSACTELSKRGYRVLCANDTASKAGNGSEFTIDRILLDAKLGVAWLRKDPDVKKVVLLGHSGGGVLMSTYQNIAENGVSVCQGPEKIVKCPDNLAGMPAADGMMLIDSNWGLPAMMLFSIDPAVTSEQAGLPLNPDLDSFNPQNGFNPAGSHYSPEFVRKFQTAVGKRNDALIQSALDRLAAINSGKGRFTDDEPFIVPGASFLGGANRLFAQDVSLLSRTEKPWPLLHADGSVTTEIVHTVRVPENPKSLTGTLQGGGLDTTVHRFLASYAMRVTPDFSYDASTVRGVDWSSSYNEPPSSVEHIKVPTLVMGMTGHWEFLAAETIYNHSVSPDKTIAFVEGANHGYTTCKQCEKTPGQFGDTVKTTYNFVDTWLSKPGRFLAGQ